MATQSEPIPAPSAVAPSAPAAWVLPPDAARRYSPFLNGTLGGMSVGERFDSSSYLGSELGAFFGPWRVALRALFPFGVSQPTGDPMTNPEFQSIASAKPALVWGASAGIALYTSAGFVTSITANFMRSDVSDFGNMIGVSLPLEWVSHRGIRLGFEPGFLRAFGGEVLGECKADDAFGSSGAPSECDEGEIRAFDREAGSGLWLHFVVGIPFDTPDPEPVWSGP